MSAPSQEPIHVAYAPGGRKPTRRLPLWLSCSLLFATVANASITILQKIIWKDESNIWTGFSTVENYNRLTDIGPWIGYPAVILSIAALVLPSRSRIAGLLFLGLNFWLLRSRGYVFFAADGQ